VRVGRRVLLPVYVPVLSTLMNRIVARLPVVQHLCLLQFVVAYPRAQTPAMSPLPSCSVIVPCRNERGNIQELLRRLPDLPGRTEVIFVEGGSTDGTRQEIERLMSVGGLGCQVKLVIQTGVGKADAVRAGFASASRDLLMILDADLSVQPEDLPKFYWAAVGGKARLVMGCRLVYPMERRSMQFANVIGNKVFASVLSWIIDQPIKDALCGTKVLFRRDLEEVMRSSERLRIRDPFGDFDLIFGAADASFPIREIPVRYRERQYGVTNIRRWYHGMVLLRLTWQAVLAFKFPSSGHVET
ncbi:MAG: glycosyltransferase family 2 protein, partial [Sulfobacillus sp.]